MFTCHIRNVHIEDDKIMVLFDVFSLYTNISIIDALKIMKNFVNDDNRFTKKMTIPQDKFLNLLTN